MQIPNRATVVLHLEASVLTDPDSVADTEHGFTIPNASWRRMTCDCRIETSRRDPDGVIVGIGRATRRIRRGYRVPSSTAILVVDSQDANGPDGSTPIIFCIGQTVGQPISTT